MFLINIYTPKTNKEIKEQKTISDGDAAQQQMLSCIQNRDFVSLAQMLGVNSRNDFDVFTVADEREEKQIKRGTLDRVDEVSLYNIIYYLVNNTNETFSNAVKHAVVGERDIDELNKAIERKDQGALEQIIRYSVLPGSVRTNWFFTKQDSDNVDPSLQHFLGEKLDRPEFKNYNSLVYVFSKNRECALSQAIMKVLKRDNPDMQDGEASYLLHMINPDAVEKAYDELVGAQAEAASSSSNINDFDSKLDNGTFYTKVDNIYVMLYTALMFNDLSRVDHKVSDEVMQQYKPQVDDCKAKNQRHMYGQLNVKSTNLDKVYKDEDGNIIAEVTLIGRYLDYIIDLSNGQKISGDDQERVERTYKLTLKKSKDAQALTESMHCPNCGKPADLSNTGKCLSCETIFPLDAYDYILQSIKMIG